MVWNAVIIWPSLMLKALGCFYTLPAEVSPACGSSSPLSLSMLVDGSFAAEPQISGQRHIIRTAKPYLDVLLCLNIGIKISVTPKYLIV